MLYQLKTALSLFLLIPLVAIVGFFFSWRFRFIQCTHVLKAWNFFVGDRSTKKRSSSFSAVSAVLGGNLGTGNISGIAVALTMGGPGALFWMWIMATLGAILKFVSCTLGVLYRQKGSRGEFIGGPMYYLAQGLGMKRTAKIYCLLAIGAAFSVGNMVQMNSLALPFIQLGISPWMVGIAMSVIVALVIVGDLRRFSVISSIFVPLMAVGYIICCLTIILLHIEQLLPTLQLIVSSAFAPSALNGGLAGYTLLIAMKTGFDRGLFATDVGVGIDSIIHSSVDSKKPLYQVALTQGLISTLSPFIVMLVCTLTGLVLLMTGAWRAAGLESTNLCIEAFRRGFSHHEAGHIITITLFFFAYTTILTWAFCADKAVEYLFSAKMIRPFQLIFVAFIPLGTLFHVNLAWTVADIFMNLMLIINMIGLIGLYKEVVALYHSPERKQISSWKTAFNR